MLDRLIGGITGGITGGIGGLVGGVMDGYYEKDKRRSRYGYGFEEHREFESHVQTEGGYSDRHARYKHHTKLPANHHARRPMAHHMLPDSDVEEEEEFYESRQSHHTSALPYHNNNYHHNGKMRNGWQGQHEDAYHDGYGMQKQNRLMAPQVPTQHVYMNPIQDGYHKYKDRE